MNKAVIVKFTLLRVKDDMNLSTLPLNKSPVYSGLIDNN